MHAPYNKKAKQSAIVSAFFIANALLVKVLTTGNLRPDKNLQSCDLRHKPRILNNICRLMLLVICFQSFKLLPIYVDTKSLTFVLPHLLNLGTHIVCFLLALRQLHRGNYLHARSILLSSFCSYIALACYLWQANVYLHYYFLLAMFVAIYLFDNHEKILSICWTGLFMVLFLLANHTLPTRFQQQDIVSDFLLDIAKVNATIFAFSCCACACFIQYLSLLNWRQLKHLEQQQKALLHKIFEPKFAQKLLGKPESTLTQSKQLCVLFLDICDFTSMTIKASQSGQQNWATIYQLFGQFDHALEHIDATRIKVNGDQYILLIGLNAVTGNAQSLCKQAFLAAQTLINMSTVNIKVGIAYGPVTYGIFDAQKPHFDIWGETVITAARLESMACANQIMINKALHAHLDKKQGFKPETRYLKGIGDQIVYRLHFNNSSDESISLTN